MTATDLKNNTEQDVEKFVRDLDLERKRRIVAFLEQLIVPQPSDKSLKKFLRINGRSYQRNKERKEAEKVSNSMRADTNNLDALKNNDKYNKLNMKILLDHMSRNYNIVPERNVRRNKRCLFDYAFKNHSDVMDNIIGVYHLESDGPYEIAVSKLFDRPLPGTQLITK